MIVTASIFGACNNDEVLEQDGDVLEATGYYENGLAYDGCDRHFSLMLADSTYASYTPSDASYELIKTKLGAKEVMGAAVAVRVRYRLTGIKKEVLCGWGQTPLFEEINVLDIEKL